MPVGDVGAPAPAGFLSFCIRHRDQCDADASAPSVVQLTAATWTEMEIVNLAINGSITPEPDLIHYGRAEFWEIPTDGRGDCDDFALAKRQALMAAGFPQKALRLAVVQTWAGEHHAVLTVATDRGDYVLDNLDAQVRPWQATGYQWFERQDPDHAWQWVAFGDGPLENVPAATVR